MSPREYVPDVGDVVWLDFNPQAGREQAGKRPALVLSPSTYNSKSGLIVCCPMTTKIKGYPFEVSVDLAGTPNVVLADQVRSLDWRARSASKKTSIEPAALEEVKAKIKALLAIR